MPNQRINRQIFMRGSVIKLPCAKMPNAGTGYIRVDDHATVQDLHDAAFTAEGWFRVTAAAGWPTPVRKCDPAQTVGWMISGNIGAALFYGKIPVVTTQFTAQKVAWVPDDVWHHYAITWDDAGDRKIRVWRNGAIYATSGAAQVGAIISDVGQNLVFGWEMSGYLGWNRISNVIRYSAAFTPNARNSPPDNDVSTVRLFRVNEMTGTTIIDYSTNAINATLVNGTWVMD